MALHCETTCTRLATTNQPQDFTLEARVNNSVRESIQPCMVCPK